MTSQTQREDLLIRAEMKRLTVALRPYGVLRRDALERAARAREWHSGGFARALNRAARSGLIERLPFGFYCEPAGGRSVSTDRGI